MVSQNDGFLSRFARSDDGSVLPVVGFGLLLVVPALGTAMDYSRASSLQQKTYEAAMVAVREASRGKTDTDLSAYVYGQLEPWMAERGYAGGRDAIHISITRDAQRRAQLAVTVDYKPMLISAYRIDGITIQVGANAASELACAAPADQTQWVAQQQACPAGMEGTHTWEIEQARSGYCTAPTGTAVQWDAWHNTGQKRNEVNTCQAACIAHTKTVIEWSGSQDMGEYRCNLYTYVCPQRYSGLDEWRLVESHHVSNCPSEAGAGTGSGGITGGGEGGSRDYDGYGNVGGDYSDSRGGADGDRSRVSDLLCIGDLVHAS